MPKIFSVVKANYTGIFSSWLGKGMAGDAISGFSSPVYKSCKSFQEAVAFWRINSDSPPPTTLDTIVSGPQAGANANLESSSSEQAPTRRNPSRYQATHIDLSALDNPHVNHHPAAQPPLDPKYDFIKPGPKNPPDTSRSPDRYDDIYTSDIFGDVRTGLLKLTVTEARLRVQGITNENSKDLESCLLQQAKLNATGSLANFMRIALLDNSTSTLITQFEIEAKRQQDLVWQKIAEAHDLRKRTTIRLQIEIHELNIKCNSLTKHQTLSKCSKCGVKNINPDIVFPNQCVRCAQVPKPRPILPRKGQTSDHVEPKVQPTNTKTQQRSPTPPTEQWSPEDTTQWTGNWDPAEDWKYDPASYLTPTSSEERYKEECLEERKYYEEDWQNKIHEEELAERLDQDCHLKELLEVAQQEAVEVANQIVNEQIPPSLRQEFLTRSTTPTVAAADNKKRKKRVKKAKKAAGGSQPKPTI